MPAARDKVFISYSHKDKKWLDELAPHLKVFEREMEMNVWVDTKIRVGARWLEDIRSALASSRVAVLLVSANYLASDFIASSEIPPLLAAERGQGLRIIWIPVSASGYSVTPIRDFQAASDPVKPLDTLPLARRNQRWADVARTIFEAFRVPPENGAPAASRDEDAPPEDDVAPEDGRIVLVYKRGVEPDETLLKYLESELKKAGQSVYVDRHNKGGYRWAEAISTHIEKAAAVIPLLSERSVKSEMLAFEVRIAFHAGQRQKGRPRLLPVRVQFDDGHLESPFDLVAPIQHFLWNSPADNGKVLRDILSALREPAPQPPRFVPSPGGGLRPDDPFYFERPSDEEFRDAVVRKTSVVKVKGVRQMGKTSLLARGLQFARNQGFRTVYTDFQRLNTRDDGYTLEAFYRDLIDWIAQGLKLDIDVEREWNPKRSANVNLERIFRTRILKTLDTHLVWGMDEVDRLFDLPFSSEFFSLIRVWHNDRALSPDSPWENLTVAIVYATEAHAFITDGNQSPFNVGVDIELADFTIDQVNAENEKFGAPLPDWRSVSRFHELVGGQPYLVQRGLSELLDRRQGLDRFIDCAPRDDGPFADHLRRVLINLARKPDLVGPVRYLLEGRFAEVKCKEEELQRISELSWLRRAGIATGASPKVAQIRCRLYQTYLEQHLPVPAVKLAVPVAAAKEAAPAP
ncbi:MAG TPA: AAA-like domain-containing protein [Candidatus Acidoferrales bacterium]|nr:AAA-like domain-containing protein [Candidatus Acidoferrales bacterium]